MSRIGRLPMAVIGVGSLGYHHARILRDLPGVDLVGIHDIDPVRLEEVERMLGVAAFRDPDLLLSRVEAAVVAVPTSRHAEVSVPALERGIHLLIEKPLASTLAEADTILAAAERGGALVGTGHVERFNGALRAGERYLDHPRFIESHRLAPFGPRGTDVAVVLDLMIHDIDLVLGVVHEEVEDVAAVGVPVLTSSVDIANARLTFRDSATANITASRVSLDRMRKIRIFQPSGYLSLDLAGGRGEFLRMRQGIELGPGASLRSLDDIVERIPLEGDGEEPLRRELEAFRDAIDSGTPPVVTGVDGRRALSVALEIVGKTEAHVPHPHPA